VSGLICQQQEERQLRATIALAESMDRVEACQERRRLFGKFLRREVLQEIVLLQLREKLLCLALDVLRVTEHAAVLRNSDRAYFSRPVIDVLEQVSVNRLEVLEVQVAGREFFIGPGIADFRFKSS